MVTQMLRLLLERGLLLALPFVAWFAWRAVARRTGRPMGSTPWPWLFVVGQGRQINVDGFVHGGEVHLLGVTDEVMYPGTISFQRFARR